MMQMKMKMKMKKGDLYQDSIERMKGLKLPAEIESKDGKISNVFRKSY